MNVRTLRQIIQGPAGQIELVIDKPEGSWRGLALVAHPHPLFGGTLDNKVAQTLARTFAQLGYTSVRPNFRGVGASEGVHADGIDEQEDLLAVLAWMRQPESWQAMPSGLVQAAGLTDCPLVLGGFSFGSYVLSHVAQRLTQQGVAVQRLVCVGTPTSRWHIAPVAQNTIVIHGEQDELIPLNSVFEWARPQDLPVIVLPGADHFFHRKLHIIKRVLFDYWGAMQNSSSLSITTKV